MVFKKCTRLLLSRSRSVFPILMGICVGIVLSMLCSPLLESNCGLDNLVAVRTGRKTHTIFYGTDENGNMLSEDDFEPVLRVEENPPARVVEKRRVVRTRFIASELGIKEKLFVAVVVSRGEIHSESTTVGINKTLANSVNKLVYFARTKPDPVPAGMTIVTFEGDQAVMRSFQIWKYIYDHFGNDYDWFFVISDDTYVFGEKLLYFVNHISIGRDLYMGIPTHEEDMDVTYCQKEAGYLLSRNLLLKVGDHWEECMQKAWSSQPDLEIARCIKEHSGAHCVDNYEGTTFKAMNFQDKVLTTKDTKDKRLKEALTMYHVMDQRIIYKLQKFFIEASVNRSYAEIARLQRDIQETSQYSPGGKESVKWPIGRQPPFKAQSRFDVFGWEYFTMTHIYASTDIESKVPLIGADKQDIDEIVTTAMGRLNEKYEKAFTLGRLVNGYRRYDPTRGMEYTLDLELKMTAQKKTIQKRVQLLRPLNKVEIIPMPYVTEYTQVTIIVPVVASKQEQVKTFLDTYTKVCLESKEKVALMLIFIYNPVQARSMATDDIFGVVKGHVSYLERKFSGAHISWLSVKTTMPSLIALMDVISTKFASDTLFFVTNVHLEMHNEFLNRVRMNTIAGWQVFFPIPFAQFDPEIIYAESPNPGTIDISKQVGRFDDSSYEHAAFYNSDYKTARKLWDEKHPGVGTDHIQSDEDLFDMFLNCKLHVFRAVDPAMKQHYQKRVCRPTLTEERYHKCLASRAEGLASRSQLAVLVFQQQQQLKQQQRL
ncbi:chondroitin sulfate synthase 2-like [Diadema antillarum]|uniref:chondroitin sulfate synthase 2-like n=1 Tax=Diadema antillarum TaxID=105358 RepID=UPI003A850488